LPSAVPVDPGQVGLGDRTNAPAVREAIDLHAQDAAGLRANLVDLVSRYRKPVVIMETATGWTLDNADGTGNVFNAERAQAGGYAVSAKGQEMLLRDLYGVLGELPAGKALGVFWWEPGWLAVPGAGWRSGDGNGWENQSWFDFQGRALPSASAFSRIR